MAFFALVHTPDENEHFIAQGFQHAAHYRSLYLPHVFCLSVSHTLIASLLLTLAVLPCSIYDH